jgi:hypothetical protein
MSQTAAPIGHNSPPPPDLAEVLSPAEVQRMIDAALDKEPIGLDGQPLKSIRARVTDLVSMCKRMMERHPTINAPEADVQATEVLTAVLAFNAKKSGRVSRALEELKRPIIDAGKKIGSDENGPFANIVANVVAAEMPVRRAQIAYKQQVENERRKAAQAEADQKAAEAAMAEKLASRGHGLVTMEDAATAFAQSDAAQRVADSSAADLTRSKGDQAGTSSLRYKRNARIVDPSLVPRHLCVPSQSLVDAIRGEPRSSFPTVPGVVFEDVPDLTVRR